MKKSLFISALALLTILASCAKNEPVEQPNVDPTPAPAQEEEDTKSPQAVTFTTNLNNSETKAALDVWDQTQLYLFGFKDDADYSNDFIFDVASTTKSSTDLSATPRKDSFTIIKNTTTQEPYYYGLEDDDKYSFFGYHLGYTEDPHTAPTITDSKDSVKLAVDIKGYNDLMLATTDKEDDAYVASGEFSGQYVNPKYLYTAYSARKGVVPNLVFEHQLARFVFRVKVGGNVNLSDNAMQVDDIELTSKTAGTLVIANPDATNCGLNVTASDVEDKLYLSHKDNPACTSTFPYTSSQSNNPLSKDDYVEIDAGGIMIAPTDSCTMKITYTEKFDWDGDNTYDNTKQVFFTQELDPSMVCDVNGYKIDGLTAFEAGKKYYVNVVIYGLEEVKVNVTLTEWDYVGEINVDKDQKEDGLVYPVVGGAGTEYYIITKENEDFFVTDEDGAAVAAGTYHFTRPFSFTVGGTPTLELGFTIEGTEGKISAWSVANTYTYNSGITDGEIALYYEGTLAAAADETAGTNVMTLEGKTPENGTYANATNALFVVDGEVTCLASKITFTNTNDNSTVDLYLYGEARVGTYVTKDDGTQPNKSDATHTYTCTIESTTYDVVLAQVSGLYMAITSMTAQPSGE